MKAARFALVVLFVLGFFTASLSSPYCSSGNDFINQNWKKSDTTDSNGGGGPILPIGH